MTIAPHILSAAKIRIGGFYFFLHEAWPILEGHDLIDAPYIKWICECLTACSAGKINKLLINIPPGHGKSTIVSVMWPAWEWTLDPRIRIMSSSYDDSLALRDARAMRRLVRSDWYQRRWPHVQIEKSSAHADAAGTFSTTRGGLRLSSSIGSRGIGWHVHRHIVDDPHKPIAAMAHSGIALDAAWEWFASMASRGMPGRALTRVVVMQRLAQRDLSGRCLEQVGSAWHHLCLPLRADHRHPHKYAGDNRSQGTLLSAALKSEQQADEEAADLGVEQAAAQHQQLPVPAGGAVFHSEWWQHWYTLPENLQWIQSWDMTFGAVGRASSWVVGQVWGHRDGEYYLIDQRRARVEYPAMREMIRELSAAWPQAHIKLVESQAAGRPVAQDLQAEIQGITMVAASATTGGKLIRAQATTGLWAAHRVWMPPPAGGTLAGRSYAAPWVGELMYRFERSRGAPSDVADEVDAASQALLWMRDSTGGRFVAAMREARARR